MAASPYLSPGRLSQILAAIQCMAIYRSYRLSVSEWASRIHGASGRPVDWQVVFSDHPEFFRESPSARGHYALVYRRALARQADDNRPELGENQIHALFKLAMELHSKAVEEKKDRWWFLPYVVQVVGMLLAFVAGAKL